MKTIKNICVLIVVSLLFSTFCFSQGSQKARFNGIRIIPIVNPVAIIKIHNCPFIPATPNTTVLPVENKIENQNNSEGTGIDLPATNNFSHKNNTADYARLQEKTELPAETIARK